MNDIKPFVPGEAYWTHWSGRGDDLSVFFVARRTMNSVWIYERGQSPSDARRVKIRVFRDTFSDIEYCKPFGLFPDAPTISAEAHIDRRNLCCY